MPTIALLLCCLSFLSVCSSQQECAVSVIGSGWGGAYFAWRLSVDTNTVAAKDICIFEAAPRIGGRVYSVSGFQELEDLVIDVGAYRYQLSQEIVRAVIEDRLQLPHNCYDPSNCNNAHIISDPYGNNAGYVVGIKALINQIIEKGGNPVITGYKLVKLDHGENRALKLIFENGQTVETDEVFLNIPSEALMKLDPSSIIFTQASDDVNYYLGCPTETDGAKFYVVYEDAWWVSKLGRISGSFSRSTTPPINGRYYDGPVKCIDPASQNTTKWSDHRIPFANCKGALLMFYRWTTDVPFYAGYKANPNDAFTPIFPGVDRNGQMLAGAHRALIDYHRTELEESGTDPDTILPPKLGLIGVWHRIAPQDPGMHGLRAGDSEAPKYVAKPLDDLNIFVANEAWSASGGWAEGSLVLTERVLYHKIGLSKPSWISNSYYNRRIVNEQSEDIIKPDLDQH